jgi:uncharacterized membrane protein YdjX (TVP38/TMEM64 family)
MPPLKAAAGGRVRLGAVKNRIAVAGLVALVVGSMVATALMLAAGGGPALLAEVRSTLVALSQHPAYLAAVFALWALLANCLVIPAGSLSLIAGGALLGAWLPALIWFAAQLLTAPILYALTLRGLAPFTLKTAARGKRQIDQLTRLAATDGLKATALLRLLPVLPNAPATILAATAGISLRTYLVGSVLVGWVRCAYFAGLGATVGSLAQLEALTELVSLRVLSPLVGLFAVTLLLFALTRRA